MAKFTVKNLQADHLLEVLFRAATFFTITVTSGDGGTVSPSGTVSVAAGADQTFEITPDAGKEIDKILLDNVEQVVDPA